MNADQMTINDWKYNVIQGLINQGYPINQVLKSPKQPKSFKEWFYEQYPDLMIYNPFDLKWYFNLSELDYRMLKFQNKKLLLIRPRPKSLFDALVSNCIQYRSRVDELSPWEEMQSKIAFTSFQIFQKKIKEAQKKQDSIKQSVKIVKEGNTKKYVGFKAIGVHIGDKYISLQS